MRRSVLNLSRCTTDRPQPPSIDTRRGRENNLALFGAQARAAARGVLSALVTNPGHGCLQWDPSVADSGAGTWVASAAGVREAVERAYERQGGREQGTAEVVVVVENMDRIE